MGKYDPFTSEPHLGGLCEGMWCGNSVNTLRFYTSRRSRLYCHTNLSSGKERNGEKGC